MRSIIGRPLGIPWLLRRPSRWGFKISGKNLNNIERQKLFQQPTSEIATSRKTWASGDIYLWSQKDSLRPSGGKWRPDRKGLFPFWGRNLGVGGLEQWKSTHWGWNRVTREEGAETKLEVSVWARSGAGKLGPGGKLPPATCLGWTKNVLYRRALAINLLNWLLNSN